MSSQTRLMLRLPADAKAFLAREAGRNSSSMNSEIVRSIRDRMEKMATTGIEIGVLLPVDAANTSNQEITSA